MRCPIVDAERTGAAMKSKRIEHGLSISKTAKALYVDERTVYTWESGSHLPSIANLIALSALYDCTLDDLIVRA